MTKQEIVNSLTNNRNFKKSVELCFADSELDVNKLPLCGPEIYVYHGDGHYHELCLDIIEFEVDGVMLSGISEFYKNYEKITKIIETFNHTDRAEYIVVPNKVGKHDVWYESSDGDGHYEISFNCHSYDKPSFVLYEEYDGHNYVTEKYYVDGDEVTKEQATFLGREHKLSRICGVDLKKEREEKEIMEKEEKKRIEKEEKEYSNNYKYSYYNGNDYLNIA